MSLLEFKPKRGSKCFSCKHFGCWTESWELPHIKGVYCEAHPKYEHLRTFPFKNGCKSWEAR